MFRFLVFLTEIYYSDMIKLIFIFSNIFLKYYFSHASNKFLFFKLSSYN